MTLTLSIVAFGLCFALFGVLQRSRRPRCGGNCGACHSSRCGADNLQDLP